MRPRPKIVTGSDITTGLFTKCVPGSRYMCEYFRLGSSLTASESGKLTETNSCVIVLYIYTCIKESKKTEECESRC